MPGSDEYRVHDVQWTHEKIGRFWNQYSVADTERYFGQVVGDSLLTLVQRLLGTLSDPILDFGCGSGHLLGKLMRRGKRCVGLDFSDESVSVVREKYVRQPSTSGSRKDQWMPNPAAAEFVCHGLSCRDN